MPDVKERFAGGGVGRDPVERGRVGRAHEAGAERFKVIVQKANIRPD